MTPEQQRALALARARRRRKEAGGPQLDRGHTNVPQYSPPGVEGYDPATGEVTQPIGRGRSFLHGAADTGTFGFADELASYAGSALTGAPREQVLSEMRGLQQSAQEQNPGSYLGGQLAGGLAQGVATAPATLTARSAGSALLPRMLAGAGDGLAFGAAYGAGSGTDATSRATEAAKTGGMGMLIGGAFPVVSHGVGKTYETIRNAIMGQPIARQAGASPEALRTLGGILDADGSLGSTGQANMARAGHEAMLVDAGPTARRALDTAVQRSGQGAAVARNAVQDRIGRETRAFGSALDNALGAPQGVSASQRTLRDAARPGVNAAYEKAYSTPIDYASQAGRRVEDIIGRIPDRIAGRAVRDAVDQMIYDGVPNAQIMAQIADDGAVTFRGMPNVMQADYIKRALNNIVEDGTDALTGKMSSDAAFASRMARDLRDALGDAVPAYREALETAADPLSRQSAIRLGSRLLSPSMTRDQVSEAVKGMGAAEKQALAQGIRSQIDDAMANVSRTVQDGDVTAREAISALKRLSSRANREKLALAIGDQKADGLFREMDRVAQSFDIRASIADNSATYARLNMDQRIKDIAGSDGPLRTAMRGEPLNMARRFAQMLTGETDAVVRGREDALYGEIAKLLTRPGGAGQKVYDGINRLGQADLATQMMRDRIVRALAGPHLSYPLATQSERVLPSL